MSFKKTPIIEPEKVKLSETYTFTISPDDTMQYWTENNSLQRENKFIEQWTTFLTKHVSPYADYTLNIEISRTGRLHLHGVITILSIKDFYMYSIYKLLSRSQIEIDTIENREIWDTYCTKQKLITKQIKPPKKPLQVSIIDYMDICTCDSNH